MSTAGRIAAMILALGVATACERETDAAAEPADESPASPPPTASEAPSADEPSEEAKTADSPEAGATKPSDEDPARDEASPPGASSVVAVRGKSKAAGRPLTGAGVEKVTGGGAAPEDSPSSKPSADETPAPPEEKIERPIRTTKGATVSDAPFSVWMQAKSEYPAGAPASAQVVLVAKSPFHCNDKYPYKLALDAAPSGVSYPSAVVRGMSVGAKRSVMSVPFTPSASGTKRLGGTLSFSVCTDTKCLVEKRKVGVTVKVR